MYYLVYGILYLVSLLPFFILYLLSDFIYILLYYVFGYRKKVVMNNLAIAFPEKSLTEREKIASEFYKRFVDTFIETIKLLSMSDREFDRRCTGDFGSINGFAAQGRSIQIMGAHQFNWEFIILTLGRNMRIPFIGVVANIENKTINRIYLKLRARYGTIVIPNSSFQRQMIELMRKQYSMGLIADQNTDPTRAYWLNFFGRPVPFIIGPHTIAARNKPVLIYFDMIKLKRGHYAFDLVKTIEDSSRYSAQELALKYRDYLEEIIRRHPANYLWSHRRWKHKYIDNYRKQWIDVVDSGERK